MISTNVTQRLIRIVGPDVGTGMIVDYGERQFIVTAAHVVKTTNAASPLTFDYRSDRIVASVKAKETLRDTAVMVMDQRFDLAPFVCELTPGGFLLAEDVYVLGFPVGRGISLTYPGQRVPELFPFVRKGCIAAFDPTAGDLYVDCIIQKGFSGAPIVRMARNDPVPKILGVITSGLLFKEDEQILNDREGVTYRSGFAVADSIGLAREIIVRLSA